MLLRNPHAPPSASVFTQEDEGQSGCRQVITPHAHLLPRRKAQPLLSGSPHPTPLPPPVQRRKQTAASAAVAGLQLLSRFRVSCSGCTRPCSRPR